MLKLASQLAAAAGLTACLALPVQAQPKPGDPLEASNMRLVGADGLQAAVPTSPPSTSRATAGSPISATTAAATTSRTQSIP